MMESWLLQKDGAVVLKVYIQPGARKDELIGTYGDPVRLKLKIASPPVEGAANKALVKYLSKLLKVSKSSFSFIRGETSRQKDLLIAADYQLIKETLQQKLNLLLDKKNQ